MLLKTTAIIVAAGEGRRMGLPIRKPFLLLEGLPILAHILSLFEESGAVHECVLVVSKEDLDRCEQEIVKALGFRKVRRLVAGGKTRQESVYQGLMHSDPVSEMILVHDGVRPFLTQDILHQCIESAVVYGGAVVAIPITETVKQVGPEGIIKGTVDRNTLWRAQTPQVFRRSLLEQAYQQARSDCFDGTDEASLVERLGVAIRVVEGNPENIKITTREDLALAEFLCRRVKGRVPISS